MAGIITTDVSVLECINHQDLFCVYSTFLEFRLVLDLYLHQVRSTRFSRWFYLMPDVQGVFERFFKQSSKLCSVWRHCSIWLNSCISHLKQNYFALSYSPKYCSLFTLAENLEWYGVWSWSRFRRPLPATVELALKQHITFVWSS